MRTSLEEERRALLEQIEASRSLYRRLLNGETTDNQTITPERFAVRRPQKSARQQLGQWMSDHPLQIAAGVALMVWLGPRLIRRFQSRSHATTAIRTQNPRAGTAKAIATALLLLARDPRHLQTTARVLSTAWQWLRRRTASSTTQGRKPYA